MIRLDKIGDLVSTLPVDQLPGLKNESIQWVVAKGLGWIAELAQPSRAALELSLDPKDWRKSHAHLCEFLVNAKPTAVIVFYAPWWVSFACWQAGVPLRIGRRSQWHSFLFFNKGLRQSRSLAEMHEADYNRVLVEFGLDLTSTSETPLLKMHCPNDKQLLEQNHLPEKYVVVHPGMFGSALNWPQNRYNELIEKLVQHTKVVVTGTAGDAPFLTEIKPKYQNHPNVYWMCEKLSMLQLLAVLQNARAVVAPSTGVLHLAAALGTKAIGIYSPVQSHHPKRWGARGPHVKIFLPPNDVPDMSLIGADEVAAEVLGTVAKAVL